MEKPYIGWTEDRVEMLKAGWIAGLSCSQIAQRIGGITRNAVIGKLHRLGLSGRSPKLPRAARIQRRMANNAKRTRLAMRLSNVDLLNAARIRSGLKPKNFLTDIYVQQPAPRPDDIARVASVTDLEDRHCKYPVGEPTQGFCGITREPGSPYCVGHHQLCFRVADVIPRRQPIKQLETA